jgi:hypothetical protein
MTFSIRHFPLAAAAVGAMLTVSGAANADDAPKPQSQLTIELPDVSGWFDDQQVDYIQTEASDPTVAAQQHVNYVPALANALDAPNPAVDDIYVFTNYKQNNIIASIPTPAGPGNTDSSYSPLWQINTVTWADPRQAHTLRSEAEVRAAEAARLVTVTKTHIVVNCPVIRSPQGGTLPGAEIEIEHGPHGR